MQFLSIKVPEMELFPSERRDEILRRCVESPEMRRLRARWQLYFPVCALPAGIAVSLTASLLLDWNPTAALIATLLAVAGSFVVVEALRLVAEYRLVRQLLRQEFDERHSA